MAQNARRPVGVAAIVVIEAGQLGVALVLLALAELGVPVAPHFAVAEAGEELVVVVG